MIRALAAIVAGWASRAYVAGPTIDDALRVCQKLAGQQVGASIGFWNRPGEDPSVVARAYLVALESIAAAGLDSSVSIKAGALNCSQALVEEVLARATQSGIGIHFDAVRPDSAAPALDLVAASARRHQRVGLTLPARWQRSVEDAERAVELQVNVRVVKGELPDPSRDVDFRAGFLELVDRLAGRARHVSVATHDTPLARDALDRLRLAGTSCQLELLFGLPMKAGLRLAAELGVATRIYVPYGNAWLPYCLSRLRRNPRILAWLMRDALFGRVGKLHTGNAGRA